MGSGRGVRPEAVAGLDLPSKLRNGLGQGKVVPKEVLARWMIPFDKNKDGALTRMELAVDRITGGEYRINSSREGSEPDFLLVHDRFDCACWLWRFSFGRRFIEASEPVLSGEGTSHRQRPRPACPCAAPPNQQSRPRWR